MEKYSLKQVEEEKQRLLDSVQTLYQVFAAYYPALRNDCWNMGADDHQFIATFKDKVDAEEFAQKSKETQYGYEIRETKLWPDADKKLEFEKLETLRWQLVKAEEHYKELNSLLSKPNANIQQWINNSDMKRTINWFDPELREEFIKHINELTGGKYAKDIDNLIEPETLENNKER